MKTWSGKLASLSVDGSPMTVGNGSFSIVSDGTAHEAIEGTSGLKAIARNTSIKGQVYLEPGQKSRDVTSKTEATVQARTAAGTVYVFKAAAYTGSGEYSTDSGELNFEFTSGPDDCQELPA